MQSQKLLKTDKDANFHTLALANILLVQGKAGDIKGTLANTNSIANTTYHTLTLARIAWAQAEIGVVEEAKNTIAQALVTSKKIKGAYERNSAIDSIAKVLANMK